MGVRFRFGSQGELMPNETVLHEQRWFRAVSSWCRPINYRIGFQIPLLLSMKLYITNRRLLLVCRTFRCIIQEIDLWYPEFRPGEHAEIITAASVQRGLFGACLDIRSHDPTRTQLYWSQDLTLRFFLSNPAELLAIIHSASPALRKQG